VKPPVVVAHPHGRQVFQPFAQCRLRIAYRSVSLRRRLKPGRLAGPPLADIKGYSKMSHDIAVNSGPQNFRRTQHILKHRLIRTEVRTSRSSFACSSSSCFSQRISTTPITANYFFHR